MRFDAFTSGFYSFPSLDAATQMTMNYYPDLVEGSLPTAGVPQGGEKARKVLTPTPGISRFCTLPEAPVRALAVGGDGMYAVAGGHLYTVNAGGTSTMFPGTVGNDGLPAQIIKNSGEAVIQSNGQVWITGVSGVIPCQFSAQLYDLVIDATGHLTGDTGGIFDASDVGNVVWLTGGAGFNQGVGITIGAVNSDGSATASSGSWGTAGSTGGNGYEWLFTAGVPQKVNASQIAYLDGTYFASQVNGNLVYYSQTIAESNQPGVSWDPLNFFTKEAYPDAVNALFADHEQLYLLGAEQSTEVWSNAGSGTHPYQRNPSYFIHYGCQAAFSVCRLGGGVAWIGGEASRGQRVAFQATGYVPQRISTAAIEKAWGAYSTVADAVAYTIIQDGHEFWVISFPTANATWVYDATLGEWHQRGWWNQALNAGAGGWERVRGAFHACIGIGTRAEVHYLGDWSTGDIYTTSAANLQDGLASGAVNIHRRRRAPHMSNEKKRRFYSRFQLDADNGLSDIEGAARRVFWNRLGASRDRIFQVDDDGSGNLTLSYSDDNCGSFIPRSAINVGSGPRAVTLVAAYLEFEDGTG